VLVRRLLLVLAIATSCSLVLTACGDDDGDGTTTSASTAPGGELFTLTGSGGTLTPVQGQEDVFDLTLTGASPDVTKFTDRPVRQASSEPLADFVESWSSRGFAEDPPNAALVIDQQEENADTSVFELADPSYDQASGDVTYRATHIDGGTAALPNPDEDALPPDKFGQAHLFIDPGATPSIDFSLSVEGPPGRHDTIITLDSPFEVFVGPGEQAAEWLTPEPAGGILGGQIIQLGSSGDLGAQVTGGPPPITGTAKIPSGADVTIQIGDGAPKPIGNGRFSVGG
jgi:hypothetical protein